MAARAARNSADGATITPCSECTPITTQYPAALPAQATGGTVGNGREDISLHSRAILPKPFSAESLSPSRDSSDGCTPSPDPSLLEMTVPAAQLPAKAP